ncbi:DUF445 domain-containing protein [Paenibacillus marinisediminis]
MTSKYIAGISLAVMAVGFAVTMFLPQHVVIILLHGGFEAGLVGGIADWFAVTALFRHPWGIPIPHTSLLLKNKNRIVESMISSMENELLNKESIESKLRQIQILQRTAAMLTKLISKKEIRIQIINVIITGIQRLPIQQLVPSIQSGLAAYVQKMDLKGTADAVMTKLLHDHYDEQALDYVLDQASDWVKQRKTKIMLGQLAAEKLSEVKMGGFTGFAVQAFAGFVDEDKLGAMLQNMLVSAIRDLKVPEHPTREALMQEVRIRLFELAENEDYMEQLKQWAAKQLKEEQMESILITQLEQLRDVIIAKLESEREAGGRKVFAAYRWLVRKASEDPELLAKGESWISSNIIRIVESNHYRIGQLVRENIDRMDDASLVRMLEDKVGKDLQWIRVNGALCGFVIGIILSLFKLFLV